MAAIRVTNIQRGCVYDGKGVRTTFFLQGCHLTCPWCCNPETSHETSRAFFDADKCGKRIAEKSVICGACVKAGGDRPMENCPFGYVKPTSTMMLPDEVTAICMNDVSLFQTSGGGVTFSGGEPLLQSDNLHDILKELKAHNIDVALETTLAVGTPKLIRLVDFIDEFIIDYKLQPCMNLYDKNYQQLISDNLKILPATKRIRNRLVFIDEMEKVTTNIIDIINHFGIRELELLKCHNLAISKYQRLSLVNRDFSASEEKMEHFKTVIETNGTIVKLLKI